MPKGPEDQSGTQEPQNGPESDGQPKDGQEDQSGTQNRSEGQENDSEEEQEDGDTFPRAYVEQLRKESKGYRDRAKRGETAISRLTEATIKEATSGILIDPSDLEYDGKTMSDEEGFPDAEKIKDAAKELIAKKPHLAPRRPRGDIGQGVKTKEDDFSLAGILRTNAG